MDFQPVDQEIPSFSYNDWSKDDCTFLSNPSNDSHLQQIYQRVKENTICDEQKSQNPYRDQKQRMLEYKRLMQAQKKQKHDSKSNQNGSQDLYISKNTQIESQQSQFRQVLSELQLFSFRSQFHQSNIEEIDLSVSKQQKNKNTQNYLQKIQLEFNSSRQVQDIQEKNQNIKIMDQGFIEEFDVSSIIKQNQQQPQVTDKMEMITEFMYKKLYQAEYSQSFQQSKTELFEFYMAVIKLIFHMKDYNIFSKAKQFIFKILMNPDLLSLQFVLEFVQTFANSSATQYKISYKQTFINGKNLFCRLTDDKTIEPCEKNLQVIQIINFSLCYFFRAFVQLYYLNSPKKTQKSSNPAKNQLLYSIIIVDMLLINFMELMFYSTNCQLNWTKLWKRLIKNSKNIIKLLSPSFQSILKQGSDTNWTIFFDFLQRKF